MLKLDLSKRSDNTNQFHEKDMIIINLTHLYVMVIEAKKSFGSEKTFTKCFEQLKGTLDDFQSWFSTEIGPDWRFIPMIFTLEIRQSGEPLEKIMQILIAIEKMKHHVIVGKTLTLFSVKASLISSILI